MNMSTWEVCPFCKGNKTVQEIRDSSKLLMVNCGICNGHGIISSLTGLPPHGERKPFVPLNTDTSEQNPYISGYSDSKQTFSIQDDPREGSSC